MKMKMSEEQLEMMKNIIQNKLNSILDDLRLETEDWGLGEMDELDEVESILKIKLVDLVMKKPIQVKIDIIKKGDREEFDNAFYFIEDELKKYFPKIKVKLRNITDHE